MAHPPSDPRSIPPVRPETPQETWARVLTMPGFRHLQTNVRKEATRTKDFNEST
jgi:hypothetical protein